MCEMFLSGKILFALSYVPLKLLSEMFFSKVKKRNDSGGWWIKTGFCI